MNQCWINAGAPSTMRPNIEHTLGQYSVCWNNLQIGETYITYKDAEYHNIQYKDHNNL